MTSGQAIKQSRVNEINRFEVNTINAGPGKLSAYAVKDGIHTPVEVERLDDSSTYQCNFCPESVGLYNVHVDYNDTPIKGSPFPVKVGNPREVVVVETTETVVETTQTYSRRIRVNRNAGLGDTWCQVRDPDGQIAYHEIRKVDDEIQEVIFTPQKPGRYEVDIHYAGARVQGCPYYVNVTKAQPLVDASKVRVTGSGIKEGRYILQVIVMQE